ncbi:MAG: GAF domain-containing protein [Gammaproteobacteria bacterium]|nr:GAF domain-containing protein [Gammaproteobacteria bacterium]
MISRITELNHIGIALSAEKDSRSILRKILTGAMSLTHADGGSIYTVTEEQLLKFEIVTTESLNISLGFEDGQSVKFPPLALYINGQPNTSMVVTCAVLEDKTINISDAYDVDGYDFSGTKSFDRSTGYRTKSMLTVPMKNHQGNIIGVLQLINAIDQQSGEIGVFTPEDQQLAESLASQAAVTLTTTKLIKQQKELFEAFIELIATSIDEKSPYTGGHCRRVPELTMMLAEACNAKLSGPLKSFKMTSKDRYELKIAGWLHDCGKVTTPEYIVDKATKLEAIFDRVEMIQTRAEVLKRDSRINFLEQKLLLIENNSDENIDLEMQVTLLEEKHLELLEEIDNDLLCIRQCNIGSEFMDEALKQKIINISKKSWLNQDHETVAFLSENEVYNLLVERGTLTHEEREVINHHIVMTNKMLESLPFPDHLKNVPEYAGGHHERMDGKGYPNGLMGFEMSVPARLMAIADIFEALTASDRPYKDGKKISECLQILGRMKLDNHIDPDIFDVFVREKVYLSYAEQFLPASQIDDVDHASIPGYREQS